MIHGLMVEERVCLRSIAELNVKIKVLRVRVFLFVSLSFFHKKRNIYCNFFIKI